MKTAEHILKVAFILPDSIATGIFYYTSSLLKNTSINKEIIPCNFQKVGLTTYILQILNSDAQVFHLQYEPHFFRSVYKLIFLPLLAFIVKMKKRKLVVTCHAILHKDDLDMFLKDIGETILTRSLKTIIWSLHIFLTKLILNLADAIVVHNNLMRRYLLEILRGRASDRIKVIPHGTTVYVEKRTLLKKEHLLVYLGFLKSSRQVVNVIRAFRILQKHFENLRLCLLLLLPIDRCSISNQKYLLRNILRVAKGSKAIDVRINPDEQSINKLLRNATIGILPYLERTIESSGVAWRYAGLGLPFVATRVPKILAEFHFIKRELLVKEPEPEAIASAISLLLNEEVYYQVANELIKRSKSHSWIKIAKAHERLYWQVFAQ